MFQITSFKCKTKARASNKKYHSYIEVIEVIEGGNVRKPAVMAVNSADNCSPHLRATRP